MRLDAAGFNIGGVCSPRPRSKAEFLAGLRGALARAPQPLPEIPGVPLSGGLVGYTAYDAVRYFERVQGRSLDSTQTPHAHYVAPRSLLVFDHLTRGVALLHDGSEAERQSLRREVVQALRGAVPTLMTPGSFSPGVPSLSEAAHAAGVRRAQEYICVRRRVPVGARVALRGASRIVALRGVSRIAFAQSVAVYVLL